MPLGWHMLLAAAGGTGLGLVYFGGLWLTLRYGLHARYGAVWFALSLLLRLLLVTAGFVAIGAGRWEAYGACLAGFVLVRLLWTRRMKRQPNSSSQ